MRLKLSAFPRPSLATVLISIAAGAFIHIAATLAVPYFAKGSAVKRMETELALAPNEMRVLPRAAPGSQPFAFMAPDVRYAVCLFDLADGPVALSATLPERGGSLTIYNELGESFYTVVAPDQKSVDVSFTLQLVNESLLSLMFGARAVAVDATVVLSRARRGLIAIRAPLRGTAYSAAVEQSLRKAQCAAKR